LVVTAMFAAWLFVVGQGELAVGGKPSQLLPLCLVLAALGQRQAIRHRPYGGARGRRAGRGLGRARGAATGADPLDRARRGAGRAALRAVALLRDAGRGRRVDAVALAEWNWATFPATLKSVGKVISEKPVYFGCVAASVLSLPPLLRRYGWTPTTRLLAFHAAAFVLYNLYLMAAYIAHFPAR